MLLRVFSVLMALVVILVLGAGGAVLWMAKRAEPAYSGEVNLRGLQSAVRIRIGPHGVPSIHADSVHDLMFAQGYMVASERMWQMDLMRRLAGGRLAEVLGADALDVDRLFRTLGLNLSAQRAVADLKGEDLDLLLAYVAGVNAYREWAAGRLPLEYGIAGFEPAPWTPEDSLIVGAYMSWTQSFNLREELTFLRVASRVGPERARELFPTDEGVPAPLPPPELPQDLIADGSAIAAELGGLFNRPAQLGLPVPGAASNAWAVTGPRTAGGSSLLANDPHLPPSVPGVWYELELIGPDLHLAGLALPGVPLVLIGHNPDLAWGFTSVMADTQDLFVERIVSRNGEGPASVERPGGTTEPIETRIERILVKGADPVDVPIRSTRHGVILNDILAQPVGLASRGDPGALPAIQSDYLFALRQVTDLPDRALPALHRLARATTLADARAAILGFRQVSQNLMLAHRSGGIAWQVSGLIPRRGKGSGAFPSPGWVSGYGWNGYFPQSLNPGRTDPPGAALITANNRTIPLAYPVSVTHAWMAPYRAERIAERLAQAGPLSVADMADIQNDRHSIQARLTQTALKRLGPQISAVDPQAWAIAEEGLLDWDGDMDAESTEAALFLLIEPALYRALYEDDLGEELDALMDMASAAYNPVQETIRGGDSSFWDDASTPEKEGPAQIWARALRAARSDLSGRFPKSAQPRLADLRRLTFPHAFHSIPYIGKWFDVGPIGIGGGADTVDVTKASILAPERALFVPSARMIQVPAQWSQSRGTLPLGQSGHRLSPYRADQLDDWRAGRTHPWPWNGPPKGRTRGLLVLLPSG